MTNLLDKYIAITDIKDDLDIKVANKIKHIYKLCYNVDISEEEVSYDGMFLDDNGENIHLAWYVGCGENNTCWVPAKYFYLTDAEILEIKDEEECVTYRNKQKFSRKRKEIAIAEEKRREAEQYQKYLELKKKYESNKV